MQNKISMLKELIFPRNKTILVLSLLFSLVIPLIAVYFIYPLLYQTIPQYTDFIVGATTISGYNKYDDIKLVYIYISIFVLSFPLISFTLNKIRLLRNINVNNNIQLNKAQVFFQCSFITVFVIFILTGKISSTLFVIFILLVYLLINKLNIEIEAFNYLILIMLFSYLNLIVLFIIGNIFINSIIFAKLYSYVYSLSFLFGLFLIVKLYQKKIKLSFLKKITALSQIFLPFLFLILYQSKNIFHNEIITQYKSSKLTITLISICSILIIWNIYQYISDANHSKIIFFSTQISISCLFAYRLPQSQFLTDFFHMGEKVTPAQQLIEFGSLPYFDYIPVHGLYDYWHSMINYLFFEGTYATFPAALVIGSVILCVILSIVMHFFIKNDFYATLLIIIFSPLIITYDRCFLIFILMIILYQKNQIKDGINFTWWWILLSIIAIAWYPAMGGPAAISFIPLVIYKLCCKDNRHYISQIKTNIIYRKKLLYQWIPLIIVGILFIPLFIEIVHFILNNSGLTLETTGIPLLDGFSSSIFTLFNNFYLNYGLFIIVFVMGFTVSVAFLIFSQYENNNIKWHTLLILLQIIILIFVLAIYNYCRVDGNFGRAQQMSILLYALVLTTLVFAIKKPIKYKLTLYLASALLGLLIFNNANIIFYQHKNIFNTIPISDSCILYDGGKNNLKNLGTVYIEPSDLDIITSINKVVKESTAEYPFFDFSNKPAYYSILGVKSPVMISSAFVTYGSTLQTEVINQLKEKDIGICFLFPQSAFDVPIFLRSYSVFKYLIENNYNTYEYNNILFMSNNTNAYNDFTPANEKIGLLTTVEYLGYLPITWGSKDIIDTKIIPTDTYLTEILRNDITNENEQITGEDGYIMYEFDTPINGLENDFLKISLDSVYNLTDEDLFQVFWCNESEDMTQQKPFTFKARNGDILIPLGSNPSWLYSDKIKYLRIDFPNTMNGKELPVFKMELCKLKPQ